MRRFAPLLILIVHLNVSAQIDPKKLDSLSRAINSSAKTQRSWQDSFAKVQDSIYHSAIDKNIGRDTHNAGQFSKEQKEGDANEKKQTIIYIVIVAGLLAMAIIILLRRKGAG